MSSPKFCSVPLINSCNFGSLPKLLTYPIGNWNHRVMIPYFERFFCVQFTHCLRDRCETKCKHCWRKKRSILNETKGDELHHIDQQICCIRTQVGSNQIFGKDIITRRDECVVGEDNVAKPFDGVCKAKRGIFYHPVMGKLIEK